MTSGFSEFMTEAESLFKDIDPTSLQGLMMGTDSNKKNELIAKVIPLLTKYFLPKLSVLKNIWDTLQTEMKGRTFTRIEVTQFIKANCYFCYYSVFYETEFKAVKAAYLKQNSFSYSDVRTYFNLILKSILTKLKDN